jgi:integrase
MPVKFYLHNTAAADGSRSIYIDARWGRGAAASTAESRLRTATGQNCLPANWDSKKERIRTAELNALAKNRKLGQFRIQAERIIEQAELDGAELTAQQLRTQLKPAKVAKEVEASARTIILTGTVEDPCLVRTMAVLYQEWKYARRGMRAAKTLSGPQGMIDQLERFMPGVTPDDLQPDKTGRCETLDEFCVYCITVAVAPNGRVGLLNNTISTYLKHIRKLLKFGKYEHEWITDEYAELIEREPLTFSEVMQLYRSEPPEFQTHGARYIPRSHIRDVYVFNCLTGPRFENLANLEPGSVVMEHIDGRGEVPVLEYVQFKNKRDKRKIRVPLDPVAWEIWQRYEGRLPVPANQTMNEVIKGLCRAAGLKRNVKVIRGSGANRIEETVPLWKVVSCHTARYTFITLQHEGGNSIVDIQESVGHSDINTTRRYLKSRAKSRFATTLGSFENLRGRDAEQSQTVTVKLAL